MSNEHGYHFVETTTTHGGIHDEEIEQEFDALQMEINSKKNQAVVDVSSGEAYNTEETDYLSNALSNLHLKGEITEAGSFTDPQNMSKEAGLEAA